MSSPTLIDDARHELNHRSRGRADRHARLTAAGVPLDHTGLRLWLESTLNTAHEATRGVFHFCTARESSGVDSFLPTRSNIGCRITRVPLAAEYVSFCDESGEITTLEEPFYRIAYGNPGKGWLSTTTVCATEASSESEAVEIARAKLLARGDCTATYAEALTRVIAELEARTAAPSSK